MVQYKLYYFDGRGAAEAIRLTFQYAKQPFEDIRFDYVNDWPGEHKSKFFYGKLPVLEIDGKQLAQSGAILRHLGETFGLAGKTDWERCKLNEIIDFHKDNVFYMSEYIYVKFGFKPGNLDQVRKDVLIPKTEEIFPLYVKLLKESGSGFLLPSGISIADFLVVEWMYTLRKLEPQIVAKYPEICELVDKVYALPQLKEYLANRKDTEA